MIKLFNPSNEKMIAELRIVEKDLLFMSWLNKETQASFYDNSYSFSISGEVEEVAKFQNEVNLILRNKKSGDNINMFVNPEVINYDKNWDLVSIVLDDKTVLSCCN